MSLELVLKQCPTLYNPDHFFSDDFYNEQFTSFFIQISIIAKFTECLLSLLSLYFVLFHCGSFILYTLIFTYRCEEGGSKGKIVICSKCSSKNCAITFLFFFFSLGLVDQSGSPKNLFVRRHVC